MKIPVYYYEPEDRTFITHGCLLSIDNILNGEVIAYDGIEEYLVEWRDVFLLATKVHEFDIGLKDFFKLMEF